MANTGRKRRKDSDEDTIVVSASPLDHYYCTDGATVEGPVDLGTLLYYLKRGSVPASTLVCRKDSSDWVFINALKPSPKKRERKKTTVAAKANAARYEAVLGDADFTLRQRANRSLHTLQGLLNGFALDGVYSEAEVVELKSWLAENRAVFGKHPFDEIVPRVNLAIKTGRFDHEAKEDVVWLCQRLAEDSEYYDAITSDIQRLQGMLHGALADDKLSDEEIYALGEWLNEHAELQGCFPYDDIVVRLNDVYRDGAVDETEREFLKSFFASFAGFSSSQTSKKIFESGRLPQRRLSVVCAENPSLEFASKVFCLTGGSAIATRGDMVQTIENLGGIFSSGVVKDLDYLVVGNSGNPAWAYSCYGRKIERAMKYQDDGCDLLIVHEHDFWAHVEQVTGKPIGAITPASE
jgi:BRCA1 C Terminus (BRCT) domain